MIFHCIRITLTLVVNGQSKRMTDAVFNDHTFSVNEVLTQSQRLIEHYFSDISITGEISNLMHARSGHIYFSLKDAKASLRCAYFKNYQYSTTPLSEGDAVVITGKLTLYPARGDFQCVVRHIKPYGEGALRKQLVQLQKELDTKGYFDPKFKQTLPHLPESVGLITSSNGAALHDMLTTFKRRSPYLQIKLYPCLVQGQQAAASIADMIDTANQRQEVDVLILARGGGSIEDLWAFNEMPVCDAVKRSTIPIMTGIGHETDTCLSDQIADQRAATPTAAAEMIAPSSEWIQDRIHRFNQSMLLMVQHRLQQGAIDLDRLEQRSVNIMRSDSPHQRQLQVDLERLKRYISQKINQDKQNYRTFMHCLNYQTLQLKQQALFFRLQSLHQRMLPQRLLLMSQSKDKLQQLMQALKLLNPKATLKRGYMVTEQQGMPLHSLKNIDPKHPIVIKAHDDELLTIVIEKDKNK